MTIQLHSLQKTSVTLIIKFYSKKNLCQYEGKDKVLLSFGSATFLRFCVGLYIAAMEAVVENR